jgi:hypothetical protein
LDAVYAGKISGALAQNRQGAAAAMIDEVNKLGWCDFQKQVYENLPQRAQDMIDFIPHQPHSYNQRDRLELNYWW